MPRDAEVPSNRPKPRRWTYYVGKAYLKLAGWKTSGELPDDPRAVLIAAPHTSGWDLPYMLAIAWVFRIEIKWIGKHTLFEAWRGPLMRRLGGIPVDRRTRNGAVQQVVRHIEESDAMILAIAPAGTRGRGTHWKSGFYHIASSAQVPILLGFLDYKRKVGGVGPAIRPTGDVEADMEAIRAFYRDVEGRYPGHKTEIRLREEEGD